MIRMILAALSFAALASATPYLIVAAENSQWRLTDIEGKVHEPFDDKSTRAVVLVFISTDCPIANSYAPLLERIRVEQHERGVRLFLIHPNRELTAEEASKHALDFKINAPVVLDAKLSITKRVGATVTPEAFVFTRDRNKPVYRGRIDDRYASFGKKRRVATSTELMDALDAVVAGRPIKRSKTKPVGCFISK